MAEVHILGSLVGASGFPKPELSCKWEFISGSEWQLIEGDEAGQTQVDAPEDPSLTVWNHPLGTR